jgi:flagellin
VDGVAVSLAGVTSNQGVVEAINAARPGGEVPAELGTTTLKLGTISQEGTLATRSRIRDADLASETAEPTKAQILQQAALASVVQGNANPRAVLALLQ